MNQVDLSDEDTILLERIWTDYLTKHNGDEKAAFDDFHTQVKGSSKAKVDIPPVA